MPRFLVLALALVLSAAQAPALAQAQKMQDITVYVVKNLLSTPHFVALENGYWADQGLNVTLKLTGGGRMVVQALQAGEAQLGHVAISGTLPIARAGGDKLVGVMPYYNAADYMGKASAYAIVGRKDKGLDAAVPASIAGKKLGFTAGTNEYYMKQWFRKRGLDIGKTQLVSMLVEDMPVAVAQGLVDAVVTWEPYGSQIVRELGANAQIMSRGEAGLLSDNVGIVGAEDYVKKNPDIVERFATGIAMAAKFVRESPAETAEIATRYLDGLKVVDAVEAYKHLSWDPRVSVCVVEGSIRSGNGLARSGQIKMDRPFVAADFYDLTAYKAVTAKHPELFAGLPPLPDKIEDCKGQLD